MKKYISFRVRCLLLVIAPLCSVSVPAVMAQTATDVPAPSEAIQSFGLSLPTPRTLTLVQGQASMATVSLASGKTFSGEVTLGCTFTSPGLQCLVSPQSIALRPEETSEATIAVATQGASTTNLRSEVRRSWISKPAVSMAGSLGICCVFFLRRRRRNRLSLLVAVGFAGTMLISGCNRLRAKKQRETPIGDTVLRITATSGSIVQSQILMVTVK